MIRNSIDGAIREEQLTRQCVVCLKGIVRPLWEAREYNTRDIFRLEKCDVCGSSVTVPRLSSDELSKYYDSLYYGKRKFFVDNLINYLRAKKVTQIDAFSGALLDVGCGNGLFLKRVKDLNWKVAGTEIAPESYIDESVDSFVERKDLRYCFYDGGTFDAVTSWHSLEHMIQPADSVREMARVLKKGGYLFIEVPNFQSWQFRIFKSKCFHLDVPRHTYHFTRSGLSVLFQANNIITREISYGSNFFFESYGFIQSCLNVFFVRQNLLFNFINRKFGLRDMKRLPKRDLFATVVCTAPLFVVSVPIYLAQILFRSGSIIRIIGEKK